MHITHVSNHILDIVVTWSSSDIIISEIQASLLLLDHCFLECNLSVPRPNLRKKEIQFRKMTHIDVGVFKSDIFSCNICNESRAIAGALLGGGGGIFIILRWSLNACMFAALSAAFFSQKLILS